MIFTETKLKGAFVIGVEQIEDERGHFARSWCKDEFEAQGLHSEWIQSNISFNTKKGTLRGMHFQKAPHQEIKLVRCTKGSIYDVIIDMRPDSPTYKQWVSEQLTAENRRAFYIPKDFAHGFVSLVDETEVLYQMSSYYVAESACGVRWDDPVFDIPWPITENLVMSDRDRNYELMK